MGACCNKAEKASQPEVEAVGLDDQQKDRETLLKEVFKYCDDDENGFLSISEYKQLAADESSESQAVMEVMFKLVDAVGVADGKVTLDEFVKFNLDSGAALTDADFCKQAESWRVLAKSRVVLGDSGRKVLLKKTFENCDTDKNGWLSVAEYKQLAVDVGSAAQKAMEMFFELVDAANVADGRLTLAEFTQFNLDSAKSLKDADFKLQIEMWAALLAKKQGAELD